jgi:hypothetical protein
VPRFIDKTDRECCREVSLLDDSSLDQSARGREEEEPELFKIFPPSTGILAFFLMSLLLETTTKKSG